jgi:hypothetical protein
LIIGTSDDEKPRKAMTVPKRGSLEREEKRLDNVGETAGLAGNDRALKKPNDVL